MAIEVKNGVTYVNGLPMDEFKKRCEDLHNKRGLYNTNTSYDDNYSVIRQFIDVTAPARGEWDIAFKSVKKVNNSNAAVFIPVMYDSKYFPTVDMTFGCVSFEGYLATVLKPGKEYSVGDLVHLFRPFFEVTPEPREMLESALVRLLAWGVVEYSDGYKNFKRTNRQFVNMITLNDIGRWGEKNLYSPEGKLLKTYNTEGLSVLYVAKTYGLPEPREVGNTQVLPNTGTSVVRKKELTDEEKFDRFLRMFFGRVLRTFKNFFRIK